MKQHDLNDIKIVEAPTKANSSWASKFINVEEAWKKTKGKGVNIAIIDTGVDMEHNEIKDSIKLGINMIDKTPNYNDDNGHGTATAGLIVGKNIGVAPESNLYVAKVLNSDGLGSIVNIMDGITFAINLGVDVLSLSLGTQNDISNALINKIIDAEAGGITVVCATGNNGVNFVNRPSNLPNVIGVGGLDESGKMADFSNYGEGLDVLAPSTNILSSYKDGQYAELSGTSMASPLVAGSVALLISYYRQKGIELTPKQIKDKLLRLDNKVLDLSKLMD